MKPKHGDVPSSQSSCSCTSCTYKSESDRPSVSQLIAQGSRIDKLYLEKYIPLREKKLIAKLVRTRAVYDDLRTQLLSKSNISVEKADLRPRKKLPRALRSVELHDVEKSSALFQIVDLVDRGAARRLSECCSCCSCGSTIPLHDHEPKIHRHGRIHMGSRSSMIFGGRAKDDHRKGKHFRHKAKHIRSDSMIRSKLGEKADFTYEPPLDAVQENRLKAGRKFKNKLDGMGETTRKSLTKLKRSKRNIANKIRTGTNKSLENIRNVEQKLKGKIVESIRKMTHEPKPIPITPEEEDEIVFNAIKDSLTLYRDEMANKSQSKEEHSPSTGSECECLKVQAKGKKKMHKEVDKKTIDSTKAYQNIPVETSNESDAEVQVSNNELEATQFPYSEQKKVPIELETKRGNRKRRIPSLTSQSIKSNARSGGLALRRCFCTLKLKPNKNRTKMHHNASQTDLKRQLPLMPYECEPNVCIPYECDPLECMKRIQNRGIRYSTMTRKPTYKSRSVSSLTSKSVSSGESKNMKTLNPESSQKRHGAKNKFTDMAKPSRQAVRLSSNFKLNIEFNKDRRQDVRNSPPLNPQNRNKRDKHVDHRNYKSSQNTSSGKSKFTMAKHNLRRCFCTLKLAKPELKRKKIHSKGTLTSAELSAIKPIKTKPEVMNRSTEKREKKNNVKYTLLPYECEPGICVPGECNPNMCLKLINQRQKVKTYTRQSGTYQRKTKSSYSVTRNRISHAKAQSISSSQNNERPAQKRGPEPRQTKSLPETSNKQAVRIGSSFSFDIEFYKENSPSIPEKPVNQLAVENKRSSKSKAVGHRAAMKDRISEGYTIKAHNKSSLVQTEMKEKGVLAQSNMKRCFCTLKLHKRPRNKKEMKSTGTEPMKQEMYSKKEMSTKSTNIKKMNLIKLEPYECEPNFCVPGQCDPYRCLERIKTRGKVDSREFGTATNALRRKSTSSATKYNKRGKDAMSQSYLKAKQIKRYNRTPSTNSSKMKTEIVQNRSSRQSVRIGSNFSFNIEFSKDRSKNNSSKLTESPRAKMLKHKGNNYIKHSGRQGISQTIEIKKKSRPSSIGPALKRCFCTLKLHKKYNKKNSPTVMPLLLQNQSFSTICREKLKCKLQDLLSKQSVRSGIYSSSFSSTFSSPCTDSTHYTALQDFTSYHQSEINNFDLVLSSKSMIANINHQNTIIGVNQYLKRSFYAMNIQVQNKRRRRHKLEPYECEPGICIPGQCNPIECQKWIMKRLMKRASTMASTETRSQSVSSDAMNLRSRKQQHGTGTERKKPEREQQGVKYKTLPRSHKQAVRVGSSFSFDIEFSKGKTTAQKESHEPKRNRMRGSSTNTNFRSRENRSTRPSQASRQHRTSQSAVAMQHKGFNTGQLRERCFCTLKLQMKGRQNKAADIQVKENVENNQDVVKTANVGQNTRKQKTYSLSDLDPNECEPGVCVPGECDPRVCLERIRKRRGKDFGTNMRPSRMSTSSMTSSQKKKYRNKQVYMKQKAIKAAKAAKAARAEAPIEKQYSVKPTRQAVRIGSSFSFNVEFYKDKCGPGDNIPTDLPNKPQYVQKHTRSQNVDGGRNVRHGSSQDSRSTRHQDSQVVLPGRHDKYTKTGALIKRCFCTLNLHNRNVLHKTGATGTSEGSPFLKRCFCMLKYLTSRSPKPKPMRTESNASSQTKNYREKRQRDIRTLNLDPNECEPGVCVPGECNPRICIERIRKRNANLDKMSSTEGSGTRSTSTLYRSPRTSKSASSYANIQNKKFKNKPQGQYQSKPEKRQTSPGQRSAVRIGSNFSFNVEFYKEKNSTSENVQKAIKDIKYLQRDSVTESTNISPVQRRGKGVGNDGSSHNRESQVDHVKRENKSSEVGLMLKRCFCTLALRKGGRNANIRKEKRPKEKRIKNERLSRTTGTSAKYKMPNEYKTKPKYDLKPYECEPGVCIPGQCDPYECEKRIKRRHNRDSFTETMRQTSKSATTMKRDRNKQMDRNTQALTRNANSTASERRQPVTRISKSRSARGGRQAVRIGSNFSFNIEFSKNKTGPGDVNHFINTKPARRRNESQSQSIGSRSQNTQDKKDVHDAYSQVLANKVRSTLTEVRPLLKRCFCTLKLQRSDMPNKKIKELRPIPGSVSQFTNTDKIKNTRRNLQPYECKPGICVPAPGKCDVRNCLKATNTDKPKNMLRSLKPYECEPGICVPGRCDPHNCLKIIQRRMQSKMSNTEGLRHDNMSTSTSRPEYYSANTGTDRIKKPKITREAGDSLQTSYKRSEPSPTNSNKQVVRIGSNFSFNIEFFKDTCANDSCDVNAPEICPPVKKNKGPKRSSRTTSSGSRRTSRYAGHRTKLVDRQLQSHGHRTVSRGSGTGPVKRCFCTLKLQKVGKLQTIRTRDGSASARIRKRVSDSRILREAGTRTKKKYSALEPYECEPNTCIPGECNPLECYERIKRRNLNNLGTDTMRPSMRSVFSLTDPYSPLRNMQTQKTAAAAKYSANEGMKRIPERASYTADNRNRQSVRLGSNFSFIIEFNKEVSPKSMSSIKYDTPTMIDTSTSKKYRTTSQNSCEAPCAYSRTQQANVLQHSVGSGITPLLKRCFCTLTLHDMEFRNFSYYAKNKTCKVTTKKKPPVAKKQKELPKESDGGIAPLLKRCLCSLALNNTETNKIAHTKGRPSNVTSKKKKNKKERPKDADRSILKRCLCSLTLDKAETNKKAHARGKSNKGSHKNKIKKQKDLPNDNKGILKRCLCSLSLNNTETNNINNKEKNLNNNRDKHSHIKNSGRQYSKSSGYGFKRKLPGDANIMPMIVEQPRFPYIDRKYWQGLRVGSNISLNIEFFKEHVIPKYLQNKQDANVMTLGRVDKILTKSPFIPTQYYIYQMQQHRYDWPDDFVRKEKKTTNMKLYNEHANSEPIANVKTQVNAAKEELVSKYFYKSNEYDHTIRKNLNDANKKETIRFKEIETILPFTSKSFNKTDSNTLFSRKGIAKGAENYFKRQSSMHVKQQDFNKREMPSKVISRHIRLTSKEKTIILSRPSIATVLKKCFCTQLFSKLKTNIKKKELIEHLKKNSKSKEELKFRHKAPNGRILQVKFSEPPINKGRNKKIKSKTTILNQQQEKTSMEANNASKEFGNPKYVNPRSLFVCACQFSERKNKFINSQLATRFTHSKHRQSCPCCVCKCRCAKQPYGTQVIVNYCNEYRNRQALAKGEFGLSKKVFGQKPCKCVNAISCAKYQRNVKNSKQQPNKITNKSNENTKQNKSASNPLKKFSQHRKLYTGVLLAESVEIIKVDTTAENMLRLTIGELKACPAKNYTIQKYHKKNYDPPDFNSFLTMATLKKKPWLYLYYACLRLYPLCLNMLNAWKKHTNKILFIFAAVVWSPCLFLVKGCKAAK